MSRRFRARSNKSLATHRGLIESLEMRALLSASVSDALMSIAALRASVSDSNAFRPAPGNSRPYLSDFSQDTSVARGRISAKQVQKALAGLTKTGSRDQTIKTYGERYDEVIGEITPQTAQSTPIINLDDFRADSRFAGIDGSGFAAVIIDTGIDKNHPFFGPDLDSNGVSDRIVFSYDFSGTDDADASDFNGHGSNVSSIVASSDATHKGMAPGANIIHLKVFPDASGGATTADIEQALQWVVANAATYNIASVNMSLGASNLDYFADATNILPVADEFRSIAALNIITAVSTGNDFFQNASVQGVNIFAASPDVIGVGATWDANLGAFNWSSGAKDFATAADRITSFSQRDEYLGNIFAPGALITGANQSGGTVTFGGTSQASPHIAGIATLAQDLAVQELGRRLTVDEFRNLVYTSGVTINDGDDENDNVTNTGLNFRRVDMQALGNAILNLEPGSISGRVFHDVNGDGNGSGDAGQSGWNVFLDANNNGTRDSAIDTLNSTDVPKGGLDAELVRSNLTVGSGLGAITDLDVRINITHTYDADVSVYLTSPWGERIPLVLHRGGSGDHFNNTTFSDEAATAIGSAAAPFAGTFKPESPLSIFDGYDPAGVWTLEANDNFAADTGTLNSWSMILSRAEQQITTPANGTYSFTGLKAGSYTVREVLQGGWTRTTPVSGFHSVALTAGQTVTAKDFGNNLTGAGPSLGGPNTTIIYAENQSPFAMFNGITVSDSDSANLSGATVSITSNFASGQDVLGFTNQNGISGSYNSGTGVLTLSGSSSVTNYQTALRSVTYSNSSNAPSSATRVVSWQATDGTNSSNVVTSDVQVNPVNDAPALSAAFTPTLTSIAEDTSAPAGDTVAAIVADGSITDPDGAVVEAVAVAGVDNANGTWQYSTDGGSNWLPFGTIDVFNARLLAPTNKIRFVPNANFFGTATITYKAWDQSSGSAGASANTIPSGGTSAFSNIMDTGTITVTSVNDTPTDIILTGTSVAENQPTGTNVGTFSSTDPDAGSTFTYTLVSGTGSTDNASFTIVGNTLKTNAVFDYELDNSYSIRVRSTDNGSPALNREEVFIISITDIAELPAWLSAGSAASWNDSTQTLTVTGSATIIADPSAFSDTPIVVGSSTAANVLVDTGPSGNRTIQLGGLSLTSGASLTVASLGGARTQANHYTLVVGSGISATFVIDTDSSGDGLVSFLELNDNDLVVTSSTVSAIEAQVSSGFNFFAWDGPGIRSSAALNDPNNLTTLGVLDGATYTAINGNVFGGRTVADTDVLVKYTYYGDADFNGLVDGTDYALIDTGFANQLTGWFNGDFDHSGIIDGTDYALIDTIFVNQGGPL